MYLNEKRPAGKILNSIQPEYTPKKNENPLLIKLMQQKLLQKQKITLCFINTIPIISTNIGLRIKLISKKIT